MKGGKGFRDYCLTWRRDKGVESGGMSLLHTGSTSNAVIIIVKEHRYELSL